MEAEALLSELLDVAERLGIEVRRAYLGGEGGGLCRLRGKEVLFVDVSAGVAEQVAETAAVMAGLERVQECYLLPEVREALERFGEGN